MDNKLVPFLVGLAFGHYGVRWAIHGLYIAGIVGAFFLGRHLGV